MTATDKTLPAESLFPLPETWTGNLWIRGCIEQPGSVTEADDSEAEFFGVYAQDAEGLHMWVEDCDTREQAEDLAKYLKSQFALSFA
ncbi:MULTISPECIES: hypothetical protein [Pseudomonas]|uniref:Uncharacterized protein n=1 Tax=Pseudomonas arsenicoxydans TaxID=702115 RepID=A0A502GUU8_9PSED|nr:MULTISPECIES: hypothetical protein [Pseudomonas]NBB37267.1 hypothetical protein [Pseudomonas sp. BC115LW]TPG65731.1 hypothetical protein EAH78_31160 [Pseudomonas arsenicoxydans]